VIIERRITLPAEPEAAWAAIVDFASWFCDEAVVDRVARGARAEFRWGAVRRAAVFEEVEAPHLIAFRWLPFQRDPSGVALSRPQTRVEITLQTVPDGVEVAVVERRLDGAFAEAIA
jgi:uncharacterized protein YndB with AHSA1/START domain